MNNKAINRAFSIENILVQDLPLDLMFSNVSPADYGFVFLLLKNEIMHNFAIFCIFVRTVVSQRQSLPHD